VVEPARDGEGVEPLPFGVREVRAGIGGVAAAG
jgi:hypothetical protein